MAEGTEVGLTHSYSLQERNKEPHMRKICFVAAAFALALLVMPAVPARAFDTPFLIAFSERYYRDSWQTLNTDSFLYMSTIGVIGGLVYTTQAGNFGDPVGMTIFEQMVLYSPPTSSRDDSFIINRFGGGLNLRFGQFILKAGGIYNWRWLPNTALPLADKFLQSEFILKRQTGKGAGDMASLDSLNWYAFPMYDDKYFTLETLLIMAKDFLKPAYAFIAPTFKLVDRAREKLPLNLTSLNIVSSLGYSAASVSGNGEQRLSIGQASKYAMLGNGEILTFGLSTVLDFRSDDTGISGLSRHYSQIERYTLKIAPSLSLLPNDWIFNTTVSYGLWYNTLEGVCTEFNLLFFRGSIGISVRDNDYPRFPVSTKSERITSFYTWITISSATFKWR
jgi:hypothetical protein